MLDRTRIRLDVSMRKLIARVWDYFVKQDLASCGEGSLDELVFGEKELPRYLKKIK